MSLQVLVDFLKMGMRVRAIYGPGVSFAASNWTSITRAFRRKVIKAQLTVKRRRSITTARLKLMNTQWEMTQERQIQDEITRIMDQEAAEAEQFATKVCRSTYSQYQPSISATVMLSNDDWVDERCAIPGGNAPRGRPAATKPYDNH